MLMTFPPPALFIAGYAAREHRKAEVRLVSRTRRHSSRVRSWTGFRMLVPALLTRMSRRPSRSMVAFVIASTDASLVTSTSMAIAVPPCRSISVAAARDFSRFRAATTIWAPAAASPCAIPRPMPPFPPVTTATLPFRSNTGASLYIWKGVSVTSGGGALKIFHSWGARRSFKYAEFRNTVRGTTAALSWRRHRHDDRPSLGRRPCRKRRASPPARTPRSKAAPVTDIHVGAPRPVPPGSRPGHPSHRAGPALRRPRPRSLRILRHRAEGFARRAPHPATRLSRQRARALPARAPNCARG